MLLSLQIGSPTWADESADEEMQFLYEVNRARSNPAAWAAEHGMDQVLGGDGNPVDLLNVPPRPPLALNETLVASARYKAEEMAENGYFSHRSAVKPHYWPNDLVRNVFGYPLPTHIPAENGSFWILNDQSNQVESLAAGYSTMGGSNDLSQPINAVINLLVDRYSPILGHRIHLLGIDYLSPSFTEAGAGYGFDDDSPYRNYWAFHTGVESTKYRFITGVVFKDENGNSLYDPGEGLDDVLVAAVRKDQEYRVGALSNEAGGYSFRIEDGVYDITAQGDDFDGSAIAEDVVVAGSNRAADFVSGFEGAYVDFIEVPEADSAVALPFALALVFALRPRRADEPPQVS